MLAAQQPELAYALLLLAYPLHPPDKPANLRTEHFPSLRTPALFVSGERDGFATAEELHSALRLIPARTDLMMIPGAGHELMNKKSQKELPAKLANAFLEFARQT